jgi:hypothetical protein
MQSSWTNGIRAAQSNNPSIVDVDQLGRDQIAGLLVRAHSRALATSPCIAVHTRPRVSLSGPPWDTRLIADRGLGAARQARSLGQDPDQPREVTYP